ncbi:RNA-directed DNA polymerase from mobile element jockey [Trichonephila clavipes]|nr:RNA-directed DNA polymerase from mobile element jockey [Trichonephila clavipes]
MQYMDATAIEIKINNFPPLQVVSAYAHFCAEINRKFPEKDFIKILNSGNNLIIAGDLNAAHRTWNNTRSKNFGFRLKRIIQNYPNAMIDASYTPTHINSRSRPGVRDSIIDLAVFKNISFNYDIRVIDDLCSDHLPVILTLYTNSDTMKIPAQLSTNWENFRFLLKNKPLPIPTSPSNEHLVIAIGRLGENISEELVAASKPKFKTTPIKLPPDIRSKIRHRNRVRRFWQRSRDPALKNELRIISNEIASDIRHLSRARWEKTIEELSPETGTLWRRTSFLKKPFHLIPPLKGALGSIAVAPIEKAEVIADSLQKQFEPNTDVENPRFSAYIQRKVQRFLDSPTCMDLEKTSPSEIQGFIKNLKPNKSPGIDLITNRFLKNLPTKFIIFIALLFNMLLENCYFPKSWRMAVVIPILKPNSDDSNPQNYRPISLLSSLSKAYEFVILNRLNQHCLVRNIIISEQYGFVTKCSTVTQLLRVTKLVHTGFQNHQATGMLFVDIAKAFDKIWHDGLISKMMRLGFSDQILKIIHSYLNSREFRVRVKNCLSSPRPVKSGIPQGSLLGPRLFNLYINDIPKADNVHLAMYADDTAIISQHTYNFKIIERLQNYITRLQLWLVAWKIKVNASKSASLLFTKQRCIGNLPNIYIFDQPVPWVTEFKYLGFILDAKLNFSPHIRAALQKAAGMRQTLNCLISRKCKLPIRHKVLLYKLFLRPILLYASPIWASAAVTHLKKLHVSQNKHLRKLTNAPWFVRNEILYKDLKIDPILDFIKNQSKKFFDRLPQIPNQSIRVIPAYDNSVPSSEKRPRAALHHIYQHFPVLKRLRRS